MKVIKWAILTFAVFTVLVTIVFFAWWMMKDSLAIGSEKFDQVKWMQALSTECQRGDMSRDLQARFLKKGLARSQVGVLLGRPNHEDDAIVKYDLGRCMQVYYGLNIYFDENGRLAHSRISSL